MSLYHPILKYFRKLSSSTEETGLRQALIKLFTLMMVGNVAKGGIYLYDAYVNHGGDGSGRAIRLIVSSMVIIFVVRRYQKLLKGFLHYGIIATIAHVYYRVFNTGIGADVIAIQAIIMVLISAFYGLGRYWGAFYAFIACAAVLLVNLISHRFNGLQPLPQHLNDTYIAINWVVIILSHLYFHSTLFANLRSSQMHSQDMAEVALAKSNFLSTMSHELRTPLNSVIGLAELLRDDYKDENQRKQLEVLLFSAHGLLSLINDILDINKLDAGKLALESTPFVLNTLATGIAKAMEAEAREKMINFELSVDPELSKLSFIGDPTRLGQVLNNLIGNAIKFTEKGNVELKISQIENDELSSTLLFEVMDTGIGITPAQQKLIFLPFQQAMASTTRKYGGTGLGLTIVRELLTMFGSKITVQSQVGKGTKMSFVLKLRHTATLPAQEKHGIATESDFSNLRVLLAEDNDVNIFFMKQLFKRWKIQAHFAENGQYALDQMQNNDYDVILMDMYMPEMDGLTATKNIRQLPDTQKASTYIIALTASVSDELQQKVKESGINDFLQKPFQLEELRQKLEIAISEMQV